MLRLAEPRSPAFWIASREDKRIALPAPLTLNFPPHFPDKSPNARYVAPTNEPESIGSHRRPPSGIGGADFRADHHLRQRKQNRSHVWNAKGHPAAGARFDFDTELLEVSP